jgi:hypothetical protein
MKKVHVFQFDFAFAQQFSVPSNHVRTCSPLASLSLSLVSDTPCLTCLADMVVYEQVGCFSIMRIRMTIVSLLSNNEKGEWSPQCFVLTHSLLLPTPSAPSWRSCAHTSLKTQLSSSHALRLSGSAAQFRGVQATECVQLSCPPSPNLCSQDLVSGGGREGGWVGEREGGSARASKRVKGAIGGV